MTATTDTSEEIAALRELADDIFRAATEPVLDKQEVALGFDHRLWSLLEESGLTLLTTSEERGGSGAGPAELMVVLERVGYHAAPVPLPEHDFLATWLAHSAELPITEEPATIAVTSAAMHNRRLTTTVHAVPWAEIAHTLVVVGDGFVASLQADDYTVSAATDVGGQPVGSVAIDTELAEARVVHDIGDFAREVRTRGAFARAAQTCGALARSLDLTRDHVMHREQFGRPIAKFQAVQALVADAAAALALAKSATEAATDAAVKHGFASPRTEFAVAVAKIETANAAAVVARNAHQAHGAIGFTLDHRLRHFTGRAMAWRSDFGSQREWERRVGQSVLESNCSVWDFVTADGATTP